MRILIADAFPETGVSILVARGHEVVYEPSTSTSQLASSVAGVDVLVVRSTVVDAGVFETDQLHTVIRAGAGVNTIDLSAARTAGVRVCNTPGQNAAAVAELTLGLMLAIDRKIADNVIDLRAGTWNKALYSNARGLKGRTLGIVGIGSIGKEVAIRAKAFDMQLAAFHRPGSSTEKEAFFDNHGIARYASVEELAGVSDYLTVHVPAGASTEGLLGEHILSLMQPGSVVLNLSRSSIVDEPALIRALDEQDLWAGIDVFADEPSASTGSIDSALARHPRVYGTHHIGASTAEAQQAVSDAVIRVIDSLETDNVLYEVT
ncbi:MAG: hydroxyacid dehydrogenase [Acidimicrobiia bacterium]|nr:hydroxyacid dehydrogenase [Acidimicrobiia bacterium]